MRRVSACSSAIVSGAEQRLGNFAFDPKTGPGAPDEVDG
jgi:hypothetical protein